MRGNNFLPIDLGKRQKQILNPNRNNRRVIQYSYNLINNAGNEEDLARKDISVKQNSTNSLIKTYGTGTASQYDVYGRPALATRQGIPERKMSLPSTQKSQSQQNGSKGSESKKVDSTVLSLSRERKTSLNYSRQAVTTDCRQKSEESDVQKYSSYNRNDRPNRYSDPLYEQRSLPPIPYRSPYYSEASTTNSWTPDILDRPKLSQFSKSQSSLVTTGTVARKERRGFSHGK